MVAELGPGSAAAEENGMALHSRIGEVTERIRLRSRDTRALYRERIARAGEAGPRRAGLAAATSPTASHLVAPRAARE
jgi:hypothetical protein